MSLTIGIQFNRKLEIIFFFYLLFVKKKYGSGVFLSFCVFCANLKKKKIQLQHIKIIEKHKKKINLKIFQVKYIFKMLLNTVSNIKTNETFTSKKLVYKKYLCPINST
jgi:hypothetical protein